MVRRMVVRATVLLAFLCLSASLSLARGLYKGDGRRTHLYYHPQGNPWSVRLNGAFGGHGAYRAWDARDQPLYIGAPGGYYSTYGLSYSDWKFGYYGYGGIEFNLGHGLSLEPYGLYRSIETPYNVMYGYVPSLGPTHFDSLDSQVYGAGFNLRAYRNWFTGAAYLGFGGGFAHGEAHWLSQGTGQRITSRQDQGDFHLLSGIEFYASRSLALGVELGWRWSGLDGLNEFDGGFVGARMGVMFGQNR